MPKLKIDEETKRYITNSETVKVITEKIFKGCYLSAYQPDWRFGFPPYLTQRPSTFDIPDYILGLLAEHLGLPWVWKISPSTLKLEFDQFQAWKKEQEKLWKEWIGTHQGEALAR